MGKAIIANLPYNWLIRKFRVCFEKMQERDKRTKVLVLVPISKDTWEFVNEFFCNPKWRLVQVFSKKSNNFL